MKTIRLLSEISPDDSGLYGGKATALRRLQELGLRLPATLCISTAAYRQFVSHNGLQEKVKIELNRKKFSDMRWEEIWDAALRIRSLFLRHELSAELSLELSNAVAGNFGNMPVTVRSSAPEEDSGATSFAGLHESFVNIHGAGPILEHVKLVWASLWSDRALLYRRELGLDTARSAMAVIIQEFVIGEVSGVTFSANPVDAREGVVEAVYGLNQGLVDGTVEPDRWLIDRKKKIIKEHYSPRREKMVVAADDGATLIDLPQDKMLQPPLNSQEAIAIYKKAKKLEDFFGQPRDIEWTRTGTEFFFLQSRPVTARQDGDAGDKRGWYLSLHRSESSLQKLRHKIETEHFPAMASVAQELAATDLLSLPDRELAKEIEKRLGLKEKWKAIYWEDFIPFAHGMRLFGQFYNDTVSPADPFEFVELLSDAPLLSKKRNRALWEIAGHVKEHPALAQAIATGNLAEAADRKFFILLDQFISQYGDPFCGTYNEKTCEGSREDLAGIILQMSSGAAGEQMVPPGNNSSRRTSLEESFLASLGGAEKRVQALGLLDLARASYRLRDDDNIMLGRIEEEYARALQTGRRRLKARKVEGADLLAEKEVRRCLLDKGYRPNTSVKGQNGGEQKENHIRARQLLGQPAGPGIGRGTARVIGSPEDLAQFKKGEVLVCDAVDPNMTFVVPLAAGVIERRGGMLIHGAIIAREYGIPCVTGVPEAATLIRSGDTVAVDGYLGIVTLMQPARAAVAEGK